ncbi:MAG: DUF1761 domain-containing protein [Jhaorihella sp.]
MFNITDISWLGVTVAALASFLLGGVWFTALFGRAYSAALGRAHDPSARPAPLLILGPAIWNLITAVTSAVLMAALGIETLPGALGFGLLIGLGYLAATTANTGLNPNIPRPLLYGAISGAYHLAAGLIIAVVLVMM